MELGMGMHNIGSELWGLLVEPVGICVIIQASADTGHVYIGSTRILLFLAVLESCWLKSLILCRSVTPNSIGDLSFSMSSLFIVSHT